MQIFSGGQRMIGTLKSMLHSRETNIEMRSVMTKTHYILWFGGLLLYSTILFGVYGYLGLGSENLSVYLETVKETRWEMSKFLYFIGKLAAGLLYPLLFTLYFTVLFWIVFEDLSFRGVWKLQLIPLIVMLIAKTIELIFMLLLRVPEHSSPFSLGIMTQMLTPQIFWVELAANITIFVLLAGYLQYRIFHKSLDYSKKRVIITVSLSWIIYILLDGATDTLFRIMKVII